MATKAISLEELMGTTVSDLFAYSGSKMVDLNDWINQQLEEVGKFHDDTLHKQGYVAQGMIEVFSKKDKKDKTKAICNLAGKLWFAHRMIYDQNNTLRQEFTTLSEKLAGVEEELLSTLTEKNEIDQKWMQAQRKYASLETVPCEREENAGENGEDSRIQQLQEEIEHAKQELKSCHERMNEMKTVESGHINSIYELQTQIHEQRRRSDNYQQKIHELEAQRKSRRSGFSGCDGTCRDRIAQLESEKSKLGQELNSLKVDMVEAKDRYRGAGDTIKDMRTAMEDRESKITRLEREVHQLKRQSEFDQEDIKMLQGRLCNENRRVTSRRPSINETRKVCDQYQAENYEASAGSSENEIFRRKTGVDAPRQRRYASPSCFLSSENDSEPEWTEVKRRRKRGDKIEQNKKEGSAKTPLCNGNAKSIKTIRSMLPVYSKSNKSASIQDHLALYQRLMQTLNMSSDDELRTYLSWTFAADSQSFFMGVENKDHKNWAEFRSEVIRHFSPHRNSHEALRYALNLKCENNQHPREYLQQLKNAFSQVHKEVNTESVQFKNAYFYGLPRNIRTQLARDYNEERSIEWIYKQAKSIFDVSRTEENNEGKEKAKPSKICEVNREKELPFEAGHNPNPPKTKSGEYRKAGDQKENSKFEDREKKGAISPRYKGNNPIPNFVYRPKENQAGSRSDPEKDGSANPNNEGEKGRYGSQNRNREHDEERQREYEGVDNRPNYRYGNRNNRGWQGQKFFYNNQNRFRRWDDRDRYPPRPNRLNVLEDQLKDLSQNVQRLLSQNSGANVRANAVSAGESDRCESNREGQ